MAESRSFLWRVWLVLAQAIAIFTGLVLAWRAYAPGQVSAPGSQVVAIHEAPKAPPPASGNVPARLESGFRAAAKKAAGSVVNVYTRKFARYEDQSSLGSGVIVSADGYVLTNNHVVDGADQIAVMLPDGKVADARVVGVDPETDLAVLRVNAKGLQPIVFAQPSSLQVGDIVLAVGDPFGVGQTVTQGIVSATGRNRLGINTLENFIQTDAAINPGNSGGALVDTDGHLVGINTAIYSRSGGSQGIGFAIPVSLARQVMEQLISSGRVSRGWLGVGTRDVIVEGSGESAGAVLLQVQRGGPADRAGLKAGDVVVAVNDRKISDSNELITQTMAMRPGERASFRVMRNNQALDLTVVLGERPPMPKQAR